MAIKYSIEFDAMQLLHTERQLRKRIATLHEQLSRPNAPSRKNYDKPNEKYRRAELDGLTQIADALFAARKQHDAGRFDTDPA